MVSIMQKINEDIMSVIEYMASNSPQIKLETAEGIFTLTLEVEPKQTQEAEE